MSGTRPYPTSSNGGGRALLGAPGEISPADVSFRPGISGVGARRRVGSSWRGT